MTSSPASEGNDESSRYNPYQGIDPSNPNFVDIPPEEFQAMMDRKKKMGIPPLELLQKKSKERTTTPASSEPVKEESKERTEHETETPPSQSWRKFQRMQKAGVPIEGILQLARVQGHVNDANESEFKTVLGMETETKPETPQVQPQSWRRFESMQKAGVPIEGILQLARVQGHVNDANESEFKTALGIECDALPPPKSLNQNIKSSRESNNYAKYVKMRMHGTAIPFVLEAARNQGVQESEIVELEGILAEVDPTRTTRNIIATHKASQKSPTRTNPPAPDCYFTPLKKSTKHKTDDDPPDKVAFHRARTSVLATLVRIMVHTVHKSSRKSSTSKHGNKNRESNVLEDDLVVDSETLYQALGSFQGVRFARDAYNETLNPGNAKKAEANTGWYRSKRSSFLEISKTIGLKVHQGTKADIPGLEDLIAYIEERFGANLAESQSLLKNDKLYDFDSLPSLYVPGSRVVAKNIASGGVDMICRVSWNRVKSGISITGAIRKYFEVCLEFIVAVGTNTATIAEVVEGIDDFEGRRNVFAAGSGLKFVPWMAYDDDQQAMLLETYTRRGRIYNEVALNHGKGDDDQTLSTTKPTYSYKVYRKGCFFVKRGGFGGNVNPSSAASTGGRIVIDAQGASDYGNSLNVGYDPMITGIQYKLKEYKMYTSRSSSTGTGNTPRSDASRSSGNHDDGGGMVLFTTIPDDYLEMVWPCVVGFSLTAKAWGDCLVDGLEDIIFSEDVFDRLVLPNNMKRLIKALVKHSSASSDDGRNFQDLIQGKGEGTVFLFYGPPGVGKTLTAEAVAEELKRPLYSLSMGTLGTTADDLERRLSEILRLTAKWNAILLLDEADSFLEQRSSSSSLERNAMVAVMLRLVEYFSGILFLTSNRMDSLDPAFLTRITLSLPYHDLTNQGRKQIWDNLLHKSGIENRKRRSSWIDTKQLAGFPLNGREIKNAFRLALALAAEEKSTVTHELLMETSAMVKPVSNSEQAQTTIGSSLLTKVVVILWTALLGTMACHILFAHRDPLTIDEDIDDSYRWWKSVLNAKKTI